MKKLIALMLALLMTVGLLAACGEPAAPKPTDGGDSSSAAANTNNPANTLHAIPSADKYRSYYQVWIGSFHDSDGDEIGDLPGLIEKLDYINDGDPDGGDDLGCDGIWLSPMMPSSTYHKYNVENYYDIDPEFGTLDDFDKLIEECHKRGVVVIIDLVLNHSGAGLDVFQKACDELREGKEDGYARYYNFSTEQDSTYQYAVSGSDYYYQADFWDQMPDWNLSFEGTRDYFEDVTKFWLDRGADGFRLDAVKYFSDSHTDGKEFLSWFYTMAQGYKDDVYMVGEDWDDAGNVYDMYESGIDSLFNFKFAGSGGEFFMGSGGLTEDCVKKLMKYENNIKKRDESAINANFLSNHDMPRVGNMMGAAQNKMAAALYLLAPGNSFTYYGEEIGIKGNGSNDDAYYRTAMIWDNDNLPKIYANGVHHVDENPLGGVKQQLSDQDSLLNTYRLLYKIRLQNPGIARGTITETVSFGDSAVAGYVIEYDGERLMVVHNSDDEPKELTVDAISSPELRGWSIAGADEDEEPDDTAVALSGTALTMPARSSVVLKEAK